MKILSKYIQESKALKTKYNESERLDSNFGAFLACFIISIPLILVSVNMYSIFIMRPFLLAIIIYLVFLIVVFLFFLFKKSILKRTRLEDVNYNLILLVNFLIAFLVMTLILSIILIFIIPKFVL